jgi:hypothetical protein
MTTLLTLFAIALLIGTIGTLFAGLYSMGVGGDYDALRSNQLMFKRVAWQAAAVAVIVALLLVAR